jgi:hypothetical protein
MATLMTAALTLLNNDIGDNWSSTTTANGAVSKLTLVDDALYEKVADWVNDGMVLYLPLGPTGAGSEETRVVDSLSGNTLTLKTSASAQILSGVSYQIHRLFTRSQKLVALRDASTLLFPEYHEVIRNMATVITTSYKYEFDISSLGIYHNRPRQVLLSQQIIRNIWVKNTVYALDSYVRPTTLSKFTGYVYKCTTAGTSHATTEPTWPTTIGGTVTDGTVVWTCQEELDYSNYPMIPLHDWDITPDGRLFFPYSFTAGYAIMIVGIKPLAFTGSGASETISLDDPFSRTLSAQAIVQLAKMRKSNAQIKDAKFWDDTLRTWQEELALRKIKYWMRPPDGTMISGPGLSV